MRPWFLIFIYWRLGGTPMQTRLSPAHPDYGKLSLAELEDRIRDRAYDLYDKRGQLDGHALDDWLEAKAEVLGVVQNPSQRTKRI
jgi:hypothetical protein